MAQTRSLVPLAAVASVFGLYGWAVFAFAFRHDGVIGPHYNVPGTDFMVYYGAARAALEGHLPLLYDGGRFTASLNARFAHLLSGNLPFHPWVYPPPYLLLLLPFGLLPFGFACSLFLVLSFGALVAVLGLRYRGERLAAIAGSLLLAPAASIMALTGQNGFLTGALLIGGMTLAAKRPVASGILLGALTYKPQFWFMVPAALIAARQWRALAATVIAAAIAVVGSLLAFGVTPWIALAHELFAPSDEFRTAWRQWSALFGDDVFACAALLGASDPVAKAAQAAASLVAAGCVAWAWRRDMREAPRMALLLAASCLAAPHLQGYDMILLAAAAAIFFCDRLDRGLRPGDGALALALWLLPLFNPPRMTPAGFSTPFIELAFIALVMRRESRTAEVAEHALAAAGPRAKRQ